MERKKILIVDDEPELRKAVKIRLENNNYKVITAKDGFEGLEKAKLEKPNLIILDVMMSGMGGYEVCMQLKQSEQTQNIPVLMLSARGGDIDSQMGLDSGAGSSSADRRRGRHRPVFRRHVRLDVRQPGPDHSGDDPGVSAAATYPTGVRRGRGSRLVRGNPATAGLQRPT